MKSEHVRIAVATVKSAAILKKTRAIAVVKVGVEREVVVAVGIRVRSAHAAKEQG